MDNGHFKKMLSESLESVRQARTEDDRRRLMSTVGQDLAKMMAPFLTEVANSARANKENLKEAMQELMGQVSARELAIDTKPITDAIERAMGNVYIPEPKVTITSPQVIVPEIKMPTEMDIKGWVRLMGVDMENPLPVQIRDARGKPVVFPESFAQIMGGGSGGGKSDFFTIKGFMSSAFAELMNSDGRVKVELPTGSSGLTDTELRASAVPVSQISGANWSVTASLETTSAIYNGDNRIRVSVETGGSGLTDAELRATAVPMSQVSGARWSTEATQGTSPWVVSATDLDVRDLVNATDSVAAYQVSGARWSTEATQSGSWTVALSGSLASTVVTGTTVADAIDDGSAPVQVGGVARTANPTAVAGGDIVKTSHDDLGRILTRPVQVRDLTLTAYASLTNGTETTLRAAVAGAYLDLIYVMGANNSDAAVTVDIRPVTAGNIVMTLQIPANGTAGIACPVPLPASDTGNNWTADMGDLTGTTVYLTALFSQEV